MLDIYFYLERTMHDGCPGQFNNGKEVIDKLREMGLAKQFMFDVLKVICKNCEKIFFMETYEANCPECNCVHGVTPCNAFDTSNVESAGIGYLQLIAPPPNLL